MHDTFEDTVYHLQRLCSRNAESWLQQVAAAAVVVMLVVVVVVVLVVVVVVLVVVVVMVVAMLMVMVIAIALVTSAMTKPTTNAGRTRQQRPQRHAGRRHARQEDGQGA